MKFIRSIVTSLLLVSIPAMAIPQMPEASSYQDEQDPSNIPDISYDEIVRYIERIENEDLEEICDPEDLERLALFLAQLAKSGLLEEDGEEAEKLQRDIEELLFDDEIPDEIPNALSYSLTHHEMTPVALYGDDYQATQCKNWLKKVGKSIENSLKTLKKAGRAVKKAQKKVKKFVKEHKTEILIGAAVIVTVVVVVLTVGTGTGAGAAAVGAAAAAAADSSERSKSTGRDYQSEEEIGEQEIPPDVNLSMVLDERISSFKEELLEKQLVVISQNMTREESVAFIEKTRELGSVLAHKTLEGVADVASIIPQILQEAKSLLPDTYFPPNKYSQSSPIKTFEEMIFSGHQKIDQIFATDQAEAYTSGIHGSDKFVHGIMPLPGTIGTGRIPATQATNIRGWKVGDSIRNRTVFGNVPKWSTVRKRYWKNQAYRYAEKYEAHELERMKNGWAPQRFNAKGQLESKELHHIPPQREGGLFDFVEVWPDEHAVLDQHRCLGP